MEIRCDVSTLAHIEAPPRTSLNAAKVAASGQLFDWLSAGGGERSGSEPAAGLAFTDVSLPRKNAGLRNKAEKTGGEIGCRVGGARWASGPPLSGLYYINGDPTRTSIKLCKAHLEEQPHPLC